MKKLYTFHLIALLSTLYVFSCTSGDQTADSRPNIVFIMADDMGYGDPGCYNTASKIPTPHIDRLAAEGMRFSNAHAPGSWCVPSRYGLLTGQYPLRRDLSLQREKSLIDPDQPTIASVLKKNGYTTICVGKWHLGFDNFLTTDYIQPLKGGPLSHGFDTFFGMHASLDIPPYFYIENERVLAPPSDSIGASHSEGWTPIQGAFWRADGVPYRSAGSNDAAERSLGYVQRRQDGMGAGEIRRQVEDRQRALV